MNKITNPFSPGAGTPPPELAGRETIMELAQVLCARVKQGKTEKCMLLTGLRGVGKTVLLNEIEGIARKSDYSTISLEAVEDKRLGAMLAPKLWQLLFQFDRMKGTGQKVKRGMAVLRSFIGTLKLSSGDFSVSLDVNPEKGTSDTGDLDTDLPELFCAVAEAAVDRNARIAILIDEIQYLNQKELGALIMAMHKVQQRQLPVVFVGAGLPILPGLTGESKSYAERLFRFPEIGALSESDAASALQEPAQGLGVRFTEAALKEIFKLTQGYPYFLQEWGQKAWNLAIKSPIDIGIVQSVTPIVITELDQSFFKVRFDRMTPSEKIFLRAMAELGPGPHRISDLAEKLDVKVTSLGPRRAKIIAKGMIYSPSYGDIAFTVPLFDQFMKRDIPQFP